MTAPPDQPAEPRRRLHPLTPLLRGATGFAVVAAAISLQGLLQLGLYRAALILAVAGVGGLAVSWVSWLVTGYHVVGRELRVYEGLLVRRSRTIPLERLQAVDVVRPLLARLTGLAALRLEVVGANSTEAPLAYLTVAEASALRDRLLALARGGPEGAPPSMEEHRLHVVPTRTLMVAQMLTPEAMFFPLALAAPVLFFSFKPDLTLAGVVGVVTAVFGVAWRPVHRVISEYGFTVATAPEGLRLRRGLLETRSQTVPAGRVQAIGVTWPLLWRTQGWVRCRIDVAGYGQDGDGLRAGVLLPVADEDIARHVVARVLPGVDYAALPLRPPPRGARWRVPLQRHVLRAGLAPEVFAARSGLITWQLVVVPYARIQSVRLVQGPWQRLLGLASVHADTAGGLAAVAAHRDLAEARVVAAELTERSRAARARPAG